MKRCRFVLILLVALSAPACTSSSLKNLRIVSFASFDRIDKSQLKGTIAIRSLYGATENKTETNEFYDSQGSSIGEIFQKVEQQVPDHLGFAKLNVLVFGDRTVKQVKLEDLLEFAYRVAKNPSASKVVIARGNATDFYRVATLSGNMAGRSLLHTVQSAEKSLVIPKTNINNLFPLLHDEGHDLTLPYMEWNAEEKKARILGTALFHANMFTGRFVPEHQAPLLMMMLKQHSKRFYFTRNLFISGKIDSVTVNVRKYTTRKRLTVGSDGTLKVSVRMKMEGSIVAYSSNNIKNPTQFKDSVERKMTEALTEDCKEIVNLLRTSNCDALGIGRDLMAFHPALWKKLKARPVMQQVDITPSVQFRIMSEGIKK
ncbi:Ger(x)C family spore germination protein [Cohnella suwonensis]|uniref:Ger(X)C family spore germination protein n=1 Tax=Cohnella suwonensis TaxID=696072 RepID=A0ABW0LSZ2_9BACL